MSLFLKILKWGAVSIFVAFAALVVLTDSNGIIRALHPGKTQNDAFTILSQHLKLADVAALYRPQP